MENTTFECQKCGQTFEAVVDEEQTKKEYEQNFGQELPSNYKELEEFAPVCDRCFEGITTL